LTTNEVANLLQTIEVLGYEKIDWEYPDDYRSCSRRMAISSRLAKCLWDRIIPHFRQEELNDIRPFGISGKGKWFAECVNPYFRFTKYNEGHFFKKHQDGGYVNNNNQRSILTLMIYLNDNFEGGETIFYDGDEKTVLKPTSCTGVIFNHDLEHEGEVITKGIKYILRTDIMFYRVNYLEQDDDYTKSDEWIKSEELYSKSILLQKEGKPEESTKAYLDAQAIMAKHKTYNSPINRKFSQCSIGNKDGSNILQNILEYLINIPNYSGETNESEVNEDYEEKNLRPEISSKAFKQELRILLNYRLVMRSWDQYITSNSIWKRLIESKWGTYQINVNKFPNDRRLLEIYKMRTFLKLEKNPLFIIDLGYKHVRYMFNIKTRTFLDRYDEVLLKEYQHNTAGICDSNYFSHYGHKWGWDSGYKFYVGRSPLQFYDKTPRDYTSYTGTKQNVWLDKEFDVKTADLMIASLNYMVYYTQDTQAIVSLPYYLITPCNKKSLSVTDFLQNNVRCLIPREIIVFNNYEIDTGVLIYLDGESSSLTLLDKGLLIDMLCIRLYESDEKMLDCIKEQVKKIKDERFYVDKLIVLSDNSDTIVGVLDMIAGYDWDTVVRGDLHELFECFNQTLSQRLFYEDINLYFNI
jgi:hypothetical protein